jgi:hypothetical protein
MSRRPADSRLTPDPAQNGALHADVPQNVRPGVRPAFSQMYQPAKLILA